jgi:hypothetical protein
MIKPELVARIKSLAHLTTKEIKIIIQNEFYSISEMTINKHLDTNRPLQKICKICKDEYT